LAAFRPSDRKALKFKLLLFRLAASSAALLTLSLTPASAQTTQDEPTARVIVKYKADSPLLRRETLAAGSQRLTARDGLAQRVGIGLRAGPDVGERTQVVLARGMTSKDLAARLARESDVEYAVPDLRRRRLSVPNDPLYFTGPPVTGISGGPAAGQWYLRAPTAELLSAINAETAWNQTFGSTSIVVADIDTGVRFDHPDLVRVANGGNLLPGYDMIQDLDTANDGDGRDPDPSDPGDFLTQSDITGMFEGCADTAENSSWHGTQTAGIIAALTGNGTGMASVGRNVRLLPVRALGKCGGFDSDIIAGIRWAAGLFVAGVPTNPNPARVINMSLGSEDPCTQAYVNAFNEVSALGVIVVASAGNTGHPVTAPANCAGVIAVAGLRHAGTKVGFSSLGAEVAISAPAGNCVDIGPNDPCRYPILTTSNAGTTDPISNAAGGSIYTDAYNASVGTSFAAPLVAGTAALLLSVQPGLSPSAVRSLIQSTARPFPTTGAETDGVPLPQCTAPQYDMQGNPIDQDQCYCNTAVCGAGMLDAGAAVAAAAGQTTATLNFQGTWWAAPAGSESGWGINFTHQGEVIFATWFTHDANGNAWQLSMTATQTGPNTFSGTLNRTVGPPLDAPWQANLMQWIPVGSGTLTFADATHGTFTYTVNGLRQSKAITPFQFGPVPTCTWGALANLALATNYTDTWWAAPANSESGWGINFAHQGEVIFVTWFTFDFSGNPLSMSATLTRTGANTYAGVVIRTTGPAFSAPWNQMLVVRNQVGNMVVTFSSGNAATLAFGVTMDGKSTSQVKPITRFVFRPPGTACQ
jgi:serine protease